MKPKIIFTFHNYPLLHENVDSIFINSFSLLVEAVNLLDQMEISQQNQDVKTLKVSPAIGQLVSRDGFACRGRRSAGETFRVSDSEGQCVGCDLSPCWRRRFRESRPRIFHEYSNGSRDIRAFVVLLVDGFLLCVKTLKVSLAIGQLVSQDGVAYRDEGQRAKPLGSRMVKVNALRGGFFEIRLS